MLPVPFRLPVLPPRLTPGPSVLTVRMVRWHQVKSALPVLQDASCQNSALDPLGQRTGFTPPGYLGLQGASLGAPSVQVLEVKSPWRLENLSDSHSVCHGYQAIGCRAIGCHG